MVDVLLQCYSFDLTNLTNIFAHPYLDTQWVEGFNWIVVGNVYVMWNVIGSNGGKIIIKYTYNYGPNLKHYGS